MERRRDATASWDLPLPPPPPQIPSAAQPRPIPPCCAPARSFHAQMMAQERMGGEQTAEEERIEAEYARATGAGLYDRDAETRAALEGSTSPLSPGARVEPPALQSALSRALGRGIADPSQQQQRPDGSGPPRLARPSAVSLGDALSEGTSAEGDDTVQIAAPTGE